MSSTWRQRYFLEPEENRVSPRDKQGKVHMLVVCLDYKGTESELSCIVDGDRLSAIARESKVKDIVRMYDDGSTERFPSKEELLETVSEMAKRCKPRDYFVLMYSGHGGNQASETDQADGIDTVLCLRSRDGQDESLIDDDLAKVVSDEFHPTVKVLVLADACHSAGVLDCNTPGIWGKRRVVALSGCQNTQTSTDTGDGGAMTNALIKCLQRNKIKNMRKRRSVSVQYIFNRMVTFMPQDDEEEEDYDDECAWEEEGEEEEDCEEEDEEDEDEDDDEDEEDEVDPITGEVPDPGQDINLSWPGGCDPSKIPFPF